MNKQRKFFLCNGQAVGAEGLEAHVGSHIIGELIRVLDEGIRITALAVYDNSRSVTDVPNAMPSLRAEIIGDARCIKCTRCDHRSRWEIGHAAARIVVRKYAAE